MFPASLRGWDYALFVDYRIAIDDNLRVRGLDGSVYAIGDWASNPDHPLPMLAQVAKQQGIYLARTLNEGFQLLLTFFIQPVFGMRIFKAAYE